MSVIMKADEPRKHERSRNEIQGMRVRLSVSRADSLLVSVGHKPAFAGADLSQRRYALQAGAESGWASVRSTKAATGTGSPARPPG